jgi:hypothetical protein
LVAVLLLVPCGCRLGSASLPEPVKIRVIATKDFGKELVFDREVVVEKRLTAQDVLSKATDIELEGSYVVEFEGLRGDPQSVYWMYYVNGFMSKWFASGYVMRPGDVMHWDFHDVSGAHHGSTAIIGSSPEPFVHGFEGKVRPTVVVYANDFGEEAEAIAGRLRDLEVDSVSVVRDTELADQDKKDSNLLLIGTHGCGLIAELSTEHSHLGMYASFEDGKLMVHDYRFQPQQEFGAGTGVIQASQNLWNRLGTGACENVVLMVSGVDADGVATAARTLIDDADAILAGQSPSLANAFGVVITPDGDIVRTPL